MSAPSRLPRGVVAKLRTKGIEAPKRAPGPQVDEWDPEDPTQLLRKPLPHTTPEGDT